MYPYFGWQVPSTCTMHEQGSNYSFDAWTACTQQTAPHLCDQLLADVGPQVLPKMLQAGIRRQGWLPRSGQNHADVVHSLWATHLGPWSG